MERLWSYLRRFNRMTKEMRPSHRVDILSSALAYYGIKTKHRLGKLLLCVWFDWFIWHSWKYIIIGILTADTMELSQESLTNIRRIIDWTYAELLSRLMIGVSFTISSIVVIVRLVKLNVLYHGSCCVYAIPKNIINKKKHVMEYPRSGCLRVIFRVSQLTCSHFILQDKTCLNFQMI